MPGRRPHLKSRHGCTQCKERKIKCDETRPMCGKCARRGSSCSLGNDDSSPLIFISGPNSRQSRRQPVAPAQEASSSLPMQMELETAADDSPSRKASLSSAASIPSSPGYLSGLTPSTSSKEHGLSPRADVTSIDSQPSFTPSERDNLRLMNYYQATAFKGVSSNPEQESLMSELVPELAFEHPFLLHSVLAISALHRALTATNLSSNPEDPDSLVSLAALARHHHVKALPLFRAHLADLRLDLLPALFATGALISLYTFGNPFLDERLDSSLKFDSITNITSVLYILHGTRVIVSAGFEHLASGPFNALLLPKPKDPNAALSTPIETAIDRLKMRCYSRYSGISEEAQPAYLTAIGLLRTSFLLWLDIPDIQMTGVPFVIMVPDEVLAGMREETPLALCILAMYSIVLHWLKKSLWMGPWGRRVVEAVAERLGEPWKPEMEWILKEARADERSALRPDVADGGAGGRQRGARMESTEETNPCGFRRTSPSDGNGTSKWQWD